MDSVNVIKNNRNFVKLVVAYSFVFGSQFGLMCFASNTFDPFGFSVGEIAIYNLGLYLIAGLCGGIFFGALVDRTHSYKALMCGISFMCAISMYLVILTLNQTAAGGSKRPV